MTLIAAVDENWAIGKDGSQLIYLKEDLKRFKSLTLGKTVILGRKTLAALPGGKPLTDRKSLILSTDPDFSVENAEILRSVDELLSRAPEDSIVIGGGMVYKALLPHCSTAHITKIHAAFDSDTWFPNLDADPAWELTEESAPLEQDGVTYHYATYVRRDG